MFYLIKSTSSSEGMGINNLVATLTSKAAEIIRKTPIRPRPQFKSCCVVGVTGSKLYPIVARRDPAKKYFMMRT